MDDNVKKNIIKFSIKDSQNTFFVFSNTATQAEEFIVNRCSFKLPIHPFILVVGTPLQLKEIVVYFDTIKYKVFTVIRSIDMFFKIMYLLNLEYPIEYCAVRQFIQKYLYNIKTKFDKPLPNLNQLIFDLENIIQLIYVIIVKIISIQYTLIYNKYFLSTC